MEQQKPDTNGANATEKAPREESQEEENIREMDAFVAVTGDSETNIMSCLVAKSKGVKKTIALVENMDYMFNDAVNFNQDIGGWSVRNVESMEGMFHVGYQSYELNTLLSYQNLDQTAIKK